ncbi:MAG: hypothetical protein U9Q68_00540 [Euryarchaeota archaeon]|nr:hypothetical protein [Euryarchaeota archaeon]
MNLYKVRGDIMIDETSEQIRKRFLELNVVSNFLRSSGGLGLAGE